MNQKTLIGLVIAALVAIVAAIALNHANKPSSEGRSGTSNWLAPSLRDHVNDVSKVVVTGAGAKTLATLERGYVILLDPMTGRVLRTSAAIDSGQAVFIQYVMDVSR